MVEASRAIHSSHDTYLLKSHKLNNYILSLEKLQHLTDKTPKQFKQF